MRFSILLAVCSLGFVSAAFVGLPNAPGDEKSAAFEAGFETITEVEVRAMVNFLASPALEGRDTPSSGLDAAFAFAGRELASYGYRGLGTEGSFLLPWTYPRELEAPDAKLCRFSAEGTEKTEFELGRDYTPLPDAKGEAEGEVVFLGFGIHAPKERYDDLKGTKLKGKIAMILTEEPRHKKLLDGPEISEAANIYEKLDALKDAGLVGALIVRRPPADNAADEKKKRDAEDEDVEGEPALDFGFHHTWAVWNDPRNDRDPRAALPAIESHPKNASGLL